MNEEKKRGIDLAKDCDWNGGVILAVAYYALIDANFHHDATRLAQQFPHLIDLD